MSNRNNNIIPEPGFSLVEMLIVIPIVIIMIGVFVTAIVTMTGDVLSTRASNALAYNIQDALSRIKNDVKLSGAFLATNDIILTSPQGYNNDTTYFHNANSDPEVGTILILKTYATTSNPLTSTQNIMYLSGQPNACSSPIVNQNTPLTLNTIYFIKNNTLWRRVVAPSYYATVGCIGSSVGTPWQQPSCAVGITGTMCKTQDERLVDGVQPSDFNVSYYTSPGSTTANTIAGDSTQTDAARQAALRESSTISVTINGTSTVAGQDISQSGTIREISPNNIQPINYQSCSSIFKTGGSVGDGLYWINPAGTEIQVYCDMQNGGWTRLNNTIATSTTSFNASDILVTNNIPGSCGSPGYAFTISNISIVHTNVRILLTRTTSIVQCTGLVGVGGTGSSYWTGSTWNSFGMCDWSDGIFANANSTNMTGLKMLWKLEGLRAANGEIKIKSECSDSTDSGQIQVTAWVK